MDPILWYLAIGVSAGWLTGAIMRGPGFGPALDMVLGIAGAFIAARVLIALGFAGSGTPLYTIVVALAGAVCLVAAVRLGAKRRVA